MSILWWPVAIRRWMLVLCRVWGGCMPLKLSEKHYEATRGDCEDTYQSLSVTVEAEEKGRNFIRFTLMEQRWRSKDEAAAYLRWAADEITQLKV